MTRTCLRSFVGLIAVCLVGGAGCAKDVDLATAAPQAKDALKAEFPHASIGMASSEGKGGTVCYETALTESGRTSDVTVLQDGTIVEVEALTSMSEVPKPVADAITKAADGAEVFKVEKVEHRAKAAGGKFIKLDSPKVFYEAKWRKWGFVKEFQVSPDGTPL